MTLSQNRMRRSGSVAAALLVLAAGAACGQGAAEEPEPLPYDADLIYSSDSRCGDVAPVIAPEFFLPEAEAAIDQGSDYGILECTWHQSTPSTARRLATSVGMIDQPDWEEGAREWADSVTTDDFLQVEGLGDVAMLGPVNAETDGYERHGLKLYVFEGNAVFEASAESMADTGDFLFRGSTLASAEASLIAMAEVFLESIGAENYAATGSVPPVAGEVTAAPGFCVDAMLGSWTPADDNDEWRSDLESLRQCHFTDGEDQLWIAAEAFTAPSAGGMSAVEFASWWVSARDGIESTELDIGDDARYRFEESDGDLVVHLLVRSGNVVVEARFIGPLADDAVVEDNAVAVATEVGADLDALVGKP